MSLWASFMWSTHPFVSPAFIAAFEASRCVCADFFLVASVIAATLLSITFMWASVHQSLLSWACTGATARANTKAENTGALTIVVLLERFGGNSRRLGSKPPRGQSGSTLSADR